MQIVILDAHAVNPGDLSFEPLKELGRLSVYNRTPEDLISQRLLGADAVLTDKTPLRSEHLARASKLRYIGVLGSDAGHIDLAAAGRRGVTVTVVPAADADAMAQMAFALLLEICLNVGLHDRSVHLGRWTHAPDYRYWETPLIPLAGKTFGTLGCGEAGKRAAEIAKAFGMRALGCPPGKRKGFPGQYVSFDRLLQEADVLSLHCGLSAATEGIMDASAFARMKDGAIFINVSHGRLVVEEDLCDALSSRKLYAAGLDVAATEPIAATSPLLTARSCYITPHIGGASKDERARTLSRAVDNLHAFLAGTPENCVEQEQV